MKERMSCTKVVVGLLVLASWGLSVAAQTKEASNVAPDSPSFDFSLFYTGNIQGNIEPCG